MKTTHLLWAMLLAAVVSRVQAEESKPPTLSLSRSAKGLELAWPATSTDAQGAPVRPFFELQRSHDLRLWQPLGERLRSSAFAPEATLKMTLPLDSACGFYRLLTMPPSQVSKLDQGGAEIFGYADAFAQALAQFGQISPEEFAAMYTNSANYLPGLSWDVTAAQFWKEFAAEPSQINVGKTNGQPGYRYADYRLNAEELEVFKKNGFVVSERLRSDSFAGAFYQLWHDDLPVFISCDALLHAWHRTYDAMLEEMEETYLMNSVQTLLDAMAAQVPKAAAEVGGRVLKDSLYDADYMIAVARSLLAGSNGPGYSMLGQDARVVATLADIQLYGLLPRGGFFPV
jgi:hypothetical protein